MFARISKKVAALGAGLLTLLVAGTAWAQDVGVAYVERDKWIGIATGFGIAIAAFGGALGQGKAASTALDGIARNPGAAQKLFTPMIIGLALIESLVIYSLIISFLLWAKIHWTRSTDAAVRRLRLVVEYDGAPYVGWQRQANGPSVQGELEAALARMTGASVAVRGAGRTDAGVHAEAQVAAFSTESRIPVLGFQRGLNALLPPSIAVVAADEVPLDFDPRRHARGKLYRYSIWNAEARSPLHPRAWHVKQPLDLDAMVACARPLVGEHDFRAFRAADCERTTTVREIRRLEVTRDGPLLSIEVAATAFLKNMVRILAGTLIAAGRGKLTPADVERALRSLDRRDAGPTAPAHGLALIRVDYDLPLPAEPPPIPAAR